MRLTTADLSIWLGWLSFCTAVSAPGWSCGAAGICIPSSRVSGNMACLTRWDLVWLSCWLISTQTDNSDGYYNGSTIENDSGRNKTWGVLSNTMQKCHFLKFVEFANSKHSTLRCQFVISCCHDLPRVCRTLPLTIAILRMYSPPTCSCVYPPAAGLDGVGCWLYTSPYMACSSISSCWLLPLSDGAYNNKLHVGNP